MKIIIREKSWIGRLAAGKLQASRVAIVIGKTIHLHQVTKEEFLNVPEWVTHELYHLHQYKKYGFFPFLIRYMWESIRHGYYNNRYEKEARDAAKKNVSKEWIIALRNNDPLPETLFNTG